MDNKSALFTSSVNTSDLTAHKKGNGKFAKASSSDAANEWFYKKREAELNHRYALDSARIENELMLQQWNRENEYNDPSAVAERYRAAGINPRAALSGAASGAGLASHSSAPNVGAGSASGSYGKSDVTQGVENARSTLGMITDVAGQGVAIAKSIGGLTNLSADTTHKRVVTEGLQIENRYKEQQILTGLTKQRSEIAEILASKDLKESERDFYVKRLSQIDQEIKESDQRIKESGQRIEEGKQSVKESQSRERVNDKTVEKLEPEIKREQNKVEFENKFNGAPMELLNSLPGASAFISYSVTNEVEDVADNFSGYIEDVKNNPRKFPDPIGDFVRDNWPILRAWLNEVDKKFTNGRVKPL